MKLPFASATQLARAIARRQIGCAEALEMYLARVERYDGSLNAIIVRDDERARQRAAALDARSEPSGPLHGVPMTVKESFDIAGLPTTYGIPAYAQNIAARSALAVQRLEAAGAVGAELEVVPDRVATEICRRTSLIMLSMGSGRGGDAQYLFAEDVLGYTRGHLPRHAKVYRNFRSEYERLQLERIAAFKEFRADVETGAYPEEKHLVPIADAEFEAFMKGLPG